MDSAKTRTIPSLMPYISALFALVLYINTLGHGFVLDDVAVIEQNQFVQQGPAGIPAIMNTFYWQGYWNTNTGLYRPLSLIMFSLEKPISGGKPFIHHLVSVLIYSFSILLLYRVLQKIPNKLPEWAIASIVLLYAAFPLHTEVVSNIKSRDEILAFLFSLLSLYILLREDHFSWRQTAGATLAFLLALLSKEAAIIFPIMIFMILKLINGEATGIVIKKLVPLALVAIVWLSWRAVVIYKLSPPLLEYTYQDNSLVACGSLEAQFCTGITLFGRYLMQAIWPFRFSYDYSFQQIPCAQFSSPIFLLSLSSLLILIYLLIISIQKDYRWTATGLLFYLTGTLFISNIFFLTGTTYGERLQYSPSLGLIIAFISFIAQRWPRQRLNMLVGIPFMVILIAFTSTTVQRNADWKSNTTLFKADLNQAPKSARIQYNYGTALMLENNGQPEQMLQAFVKATGLDPGYYDAWFNLGRAYFLAKDYSSSVKAFRTANQLKENDPALLHNLADASMMNKEYSEAVYLYQECIRQKHIRKNTYDFLGSALFSLHRMEEAREAFESGLRADSSQAGLWLNYGNALAAGGDVKSAIRAFEKVLHLDPSNKQVLYFLAMGYGQLKDPERSNYYLTWFNTGKAP